MSRAFPNTPQSDVIVDSARLDLIKYESSGQWSFAKNFNADVAYQGTFTTSSIAGDTATFTFNGTFRH
ncbi:hypothetical protein C8Q80DRAFT_484168 [Daedaleopsis nitida]|nr:hypothetical protein C8Q80DRAFT_484168 [Daedaleopsis nitida]